jgi:hypothetical protein
MLRPSCKQLNVQRGTRALNFVVDGYAVIHALDDLAECQLRMNVKKASRGLAFEDSSAIVHLRVPCYIVHGNF